MPNRSVAAGIGVLIFLLASAPLRSGTLEEDFASPPQTAKPYVWWHWMSSDVSAQGIDKDLAAMKECGVAGATVCPVGSTTGIGHTTIGNSPWPDVTYLSPAWWGLMKHAVEKGGELGLDIGMHNCAGWSASGGPWITPELSMQMLVWSQTPVAGPVQFADVLARPKIDPKYNFYKDVAVLAVPDQPNPPADQVIDLSSKMAADGTLNWSAPAGKWIVYRFGHTTTGKTPHPMPDGFTGLECDKLSKSASELHLRNVLEQVTKNLGSLAGSGDGAAFGHILFDSYEAGPQNWTEDFRQQFINRRGYDPLPWLAVMTGKKIGGDELSARFQWDMNKTIAELFDENNFGVFHKMLTDAGITMCFEPYKGPFDTISATAQCDVPMGEFWSDSHKGILRAVAAAAQSLGGAIVGAESFTGRPTESQFDEDPAYLKPCADGAIVSGVNKFYLHEWTMQPFGDDVVPGMTGGWWGTHFGRNQTWFEAQKAFFQYLARCAAVLQHGRVVSDFCTLEFAVEGGDAISYSQLADCKVQDGQIVTASGRRYHLLVLPADASTMLPAVARKIKELVYDGGSVLGPRPTASPSLSDYPKCDSEVAQIGSEVWGDGQAPHSYGRGRVYQNMAIADVLSEMGLPRDFWARTVNPSDAAAISFIHRHDSDEDIYFLANLGQQAVDFLAAFRVTGRAPEIWHPATGKRNWVAQWDSARMRTVFPMSLGANESALVIFRQPGTTEEPPAPEKRVVSFVHPMAAVPTTEPVFGAVNPGMLQTASGHLEISDSGEVHLIATERGSFHVRFAFGDTRSPKVQPQPPPFEVAGPWTVDFQKGRGAPAEIKLEKLESLSHNTEAGVKYFSGTAVYWADVDLPAEFASAGRRVMLDLGKVKNVARVSVNGQDLGLLWYGDYAVDATAAIHMGVNHLQIAVTDTWKNRLIGDEQQRADLQWGAAQMYRRNQPGGAPLAAFPDWLVKGESRPSSGRITFTTWNYFTADSPLEDSGLIGPVRFLAMADIVLPMAAAESATAPTTQPLALAILTREFIFETAPFPSCHASTIAQTKDALVAAWFGGTRERAPDVGIWVSRNEGSGWLPMSEVAIGKAADGSRLPCWNPVLYQSPQGPLLLFYKVGPAPATWWGMMMRSDDQGKTWSEAKRLPDGIIGPAKDKPIALADGSMLVPSGTENGGMRLHFEFSNDLGQTWTKTDPLNEGHRVELEQPTLLDHGGGVMQYLCRSHQGWIYEGWSKDNGKTWSDPQPTTLPNPNSGIDAIELRDGRSLVVYNNSAVDRHPLNVAISPDGKTWKMVLTIEDTDGPQLSYPAVIQTRDGLVHITYTWKRLRIRHVVLDPSKLPS